MCMSSAGDCGAVRGPETSVIQGTLASNVDPRPACDESLITEARSSDAIPAEANHEDMDGCDVTQGRETILVPESSFLLFL